MAIKLTIDGAELTFDTVAEYNEFARTNAEITDEGVAADEITTQEDEIKIGDKVEIIGNTDDEPYHDIGDVGVVVDEFFADIDVRVNDLTQTVSRSDVKKVDSETKEGKKVPEGYERVPFAAAEEGDFYLAIDDKMGITAGDKYELSEDYDGDLEFVDDDGDVRFLINRNEYVDGIVIRKIAEDASFKEGDIVTGTSYRRYGFTTDKALMQVTNVFDGEIAVKIIKSVDYPQKEGREYTVCPEYFVKTTEEEFNAKHGLSADNDDLEDERERFHFSADWHVEREASQSDSELVVGAKYRVTGKQLHCFDIGTEVTFTGEYGELSSLPKFKNGLGRVQCLDLWEVERIIDEETAFKVGDKVRIVGNGNSHGFRIGEVVTVKEKARTFCNGKQSHYCENDEGSTYYVRTYDAELVAEETETRTFKVGDKVRVKSHGLHRFADGTVGEIIEEGGEGYFVVKTDDPSQQSISSFYHGKGTQTIYANYLTLVTDDEEHTQEIEFEKGDVIRMKEDVTDGFGDKIKADRLAKVDWFPGDNTKIAVRQRKGKQDVIVPKSAVELVAKAIK